MGDSVKFIFKTLIKVPVIVMVSFIIFNIFSWTISYFKLVGASYTIMQVGMENNFIPAKDEVIINNYLDTLNTGVLTNVQIAGESSYRTKRQYGDELTVGVSADIKFIWPLMHKEQYNRSTDTDYAFGRALTDSEIENARRNKEQSQDIVITYTIPGLQYYTDLD